ncbi:MAG: sulfite reductase subunit alpha [Verrucomicrobia bacterium]|nr:sulfite reductase subunit alpha [Verrucomicrobiota bacterium]
MSNPASLFNRKNPFPGKLTVNRSLCADGVGKDTRHYEIDLQGSGLAYEVGDSLGIFPQNDPALVDEILQRLQLSGDEAVTTADGGTASLRHTLTHLCQITATDKKMVEAIGARANDPELKAMAAEPERKEALNAFIEEREFIDLLLDYPDVGFSAVELVPLLRKLQPRLYSIASSQKAHPDSVHLCVATVLYEQRDRQRKGVCSTFLAQRSEVGATPLPLFVHTAKHFRLPEDPSTPIIMVGPGTGIAPFRAFLQERKITGARGQNWLFFGSQGRQVDFLYGPELEQFQHEGTLHRFDTAFSREQKEKIYVQHRLLEQGAEVWKWLELGAYFYVCGDAKRMAKDVDDALVKIAEVHGGKSHEDAAAFVQNLRATKRYRRDVY